MRSGIFKHPEARLVAVSEMPTQYHVPIFRHLFQALGERFQAVYRSPGQSLGVRYASWGDRELKNETGLLDGYPHRLISPRSLRNTRRCLSKEVGLRQHDAVLFHTILPRFSREAVLSVKSIGCRLLFRGSTYQSPYRPLWRNRLASVRDRATFLLVDAFCATGTTTWRYFEKHAPGKPIVFSPYCVDEHVFSNVRADYDRLRADVRASLAVNDDQLLVSYLGRFIDIKNVTRLIDAMAMVDGMGIRFVLGGDGPNRESILRHIHTKKWRNPPIYAGFMDRGDVGRFLCGSDALALVSLYEPWGVVVNEALYLDNLCLLSPAVGAGPDLVWEGKNGTYVDPEDVTSIAAGLRRLPMIHASGAFREVNARLNGIFSAANAARGILNAFEPDRFSSIGSPPGLLEDTSWS